MEISLVNIFPDFNQAEDTMLGFDRERLQTASCLIFAGLSRVWRGVSSLQYYSLAHERAVKLTSLGNVNWLYYVVFTADFSEYTIYNSKGEVEPGEKCIGLLE